MNKRLFRLTWNDKDWEVPTEHKWKKKNQGKNNVAYENQYGYGHEEWLFHPRYKVGGYQYGYIRGVETMAEKVEVVDSALLLTIDPKSKERFIVGELKNLMPIYLKDYPEALGVYKKYKEAMKQEVLAIKGDPKGLNQVDFEFNVRIAEADINYYDEPLPVPALRGNKYNRFMAYKVEGHLEKLLSGLLINKKFIWQSGRAGATAIYKRKLSSSSKDIYKVHCDIVDDLVKYLDPEYSIKSNLSVEIIKFGLNIADVVLKEKNHSLTILEVKTHHNGRRNIREALAQLLDYALWDDTVAINQLVIVAPSRLTPDELKFLNRIQANLKMKIGYWQYHRNESKVKERFTQIMK